MEERTFNVHEAFNILKRHYITENVQTVSKFIREGRLRGVRGYRKDGWLINESDLYEFIDEEKPGIVEMVYVYDKYSESVNVPDAEAYLKGKSRIISTDKSLEKALTNIQQELKKMNERIQYLEKPKIKQSTFFDDVPPSDIPKKKTNKYEKYNLTKFKTLLQDVKDVDLTEDRINVIYHVYFGKDEHMRVDIFSERGYKCPVLKEEMKTFLPLIKKTTPRLLKKIKNEELVLNEDGEVGSPDNQDQENKVMDNGENNNGNNIADLKLAEEKV